MKLIKLLHKPDEYGSVRLFSRFRQQNDAINRANDVTCLWRHVMQRVSYASVRACSMLLLHLCLAVS